MRGLITDPEYIVITQKIIRRNNRGDTGIMLFQRAENLADFTIIMKRVLSGMHQRYELTRDQQQGDQDELVFTRIDQQIGSLDNIADDNKVI